MYLKFRLTQELKKLSNTLEAADLNRPIVINSFIYDLLLPFCKRLHICTDYITVADDFQNKRVITFVKCDEDIRLDKDLTKDLPILRMYCHVLDYLKLSYNEKTVHLLNNFPRTIYHQFLREELKYHAITHYLFNYSSEVLSHVADVYLGSFTDTLKESHLYETLKHIKYDKDFSYYNALVFEMKAKKKTKQIMISSASNRVDTQALFHSEKNIIIVNQKTNSITVYEKNTHDSFVFQSEEYNYSEESLQIIDMINYGNSDYMSYNNNILH